MSGRHRLTVEEIFQKVNLSQLVDGHHYMKYFKTDRQLIEYFGLSINPSLSTLTKL